MGSDFGETWVHRTWVGFDTETTGLDVSRERIITASLVVREGGVQQVGELQETTWLLNPGVPISRGASAIHGITDEIAQTQGMDAATGLEQVAVALTDHLASGHVLVVFNAGFDLPLLQRNLQHFGLATLEERLGHPLAPVADPLVLDRMMVPRRRGSRKLGNLIAAYGLPEIEHAHHSSDDAAAALAVLGACVHTYYQALAGWSDRELMENQRNGHREWAEDFQAYLRSKGRTANISPIWF